MKIVHVGLRYPVTLIINHVAIVQHLIYRVHTHWVHTGFQKMLSKHDMCVHTVHTYECMNVRIVMYVCTCIYILYIHMFVYLFVFPYPCFVS